MSKKDTWFDDPEWDELRKKTSKKGSKPQPLALPQINSAAVPTRRPLRNYLKKPTADDLRRAMNKSRPSSSAHKTAFKPPQLSSKPKQTFVPQAKPTTKPRIDAFEKPRDNRPVQVSINLSLPTTMDSLEPVTKFVSRIKKVIPSGKQLKLIGVLVVVAAISFAGYTFIPGLINKNKGSEVLSSKDEKPSFAVSKPDTISADEQVKFDPSKKVASYNDTLNGVNIVVSQQPLPETFKDNPFGELEKVASSFSATESFVVKDFKVYIGVSIKGPQSLILIKDKKLIFIQSESKIPNTKWVEYIETLKT